MWVGLLFMIVAGVGIIAFLQYRAQRSTYQPHASRQPERQEPEVPLGMEATDLEAISRTNRRNESLERGQTNWLTQKGFFGRTDSNMAPLADDETYATRFHTAFHTTKTKDE